MYGPIPSLLLRNLPLRVLVVLPIINMSTDGTNGTLAGPGPGNATEVPPPFDPSLFTEVPISERQAHLSRVFVGVTSVLVVLCTLTFFVRMYQRIRPVWKVGWDDYFIVVGYCLSIIDWSFLLLQQNLQAGVISIEQNVHAGRYGWIAIGIWGISMTCLKVSVALTLYRIKSKSLPWRIFLFTIVGVQVAYGVLNLIFNLGIACRPLAKAWDFRIIEGSCVPTDVMRAASNTGSGVNIVTDVLLSLAPSVFLRKLNRPLRERIFICVLMGLGLFASTWSVIKTVQVQKFYDPTVPLEEIGPIGITVSTYTVLEQLTGILAACIPALKGILQSCLGRMGVSLTDSRSRPGRSGYYMNGRSNTGPTSRTVPGGITATTTTIITNPFRSEHIDEEEKGLEMHGMRRGMSTPPKSGGVVFFREPDVDFKGPVVTTVHAV
ncbi:hypothetical protein B0T14DRAFT_528770 [Immersiella caudata]|uniref:Rhodopsin domain-containing protein n=1 Tax=Immersiella caudata TaxID=314043 RepID=A0AA39WFT6_9PEZI|nr:hypothetical protein B0T14DRAFT_528770 [Immersiella caudata]